MLVCQDQQECQTEMRQYAMNIYLEGENGKVHAPSAENFIEFFMAN